jgi:hypothetical protein
LLATAASGSLADFSYDEEQGSITASGFTRDEPGTLSALVRAAQESGWAAVRPGEDTQTVALDADLAIGQEGQAATWFRIGTPERPRETLVINGDLIVRERGNVLLIGDEGRPEVQPAVRFVCAEPGEHGLIVTPGNTLRVHNATITADRHDREHAARCEMQASDVELVGSTLSWIGEVMTYGLQSAAAVVRAVTFEHGGCALYNNTQWAEDCVFRDLDVAVAGGWVDATLVGCRFEGNRRNFALFRTAGGIMAIDCHFGAETDPRPHIKRGRLHDGPWQYPLFVAKRHIVVKVEGGDGNPIEGAEVTVTEAGGDLSAVDHGIALTDAEGKTPGPRERGSILVTDYGYRATDEAPTPESRDCRIGSYDYRYTLRVTAEGHRPAVVEDVDPDQSWVERTVTLERE